MKHPVRKKWGQNFLQDPNIIHKITVALSPEPSDNVVEIGPGKGALTSILCNQVQHMTAIEIDPLLIGLLQKIPSDNLTLVLGDVMDVDMASYYTDYKIIGNLPYYITTPVIFRILESAGWSKSILMIQKEVAERITAAPGSKVYGRLSVMVQTFTHVHLEFKVAPSVFRPQPSVESAVISMAPRTNEIQDRHFFSTIVRQAFSQRRKKLKNTIGDYLDKPGLEIYISQRPEQLSPEDYVTIMNANLEAGG